MTLPLTVVAAVAGFGVGTLGGDQPTTFSPAAPVPAESPSIPIDPPPTFAPDIDDPPLATDLRYQGRRIGPPGFQWRYEAPAAWQASRIGVLEVRWFELPYQGGYALRLKIVNQRLTPAQMVAEKLSAIEAIYDDVVLLRQDEDELSFSYRDGNDRQRFNTFRWFTAPGGSFAEFEMSVVGREADEDGLAALFERVETSVAKVR